MEEYVTEGNVVEEKIVHGTPSMVFLPAINYVWKVQDREYKIEIPRKGKYADLAPGFFNEDHGEFHILDDDIIFMPSLSKVLFATGKYPDLAPNQLFAPTALIFEENKVVIVGQILEWNMPGTADTEVRSSAKVN